MTVTHATPNPGLGLGRIHSSNPKCIDADVALPYERGQLMPLRGDVFLLIRTECFLHKDEKARRQGRLCPSTHDTSNLQKRTNFLN